MAPVLVSSLETAFARVRARQEQVIRGIDKARADLVDELQSHGTANAVVAAMAHAIDIEYAKLEIVREWKQELGELVSEERERTRREAAGT